MIIQSDNVRMNSGRSYSSIKSNTKALKVWDNSLRQAKVLMGDDIPKDYKENPKEVFEETDDSKENFDNILDRLNSQRGVSYAKSNEYVKNIDRMRRQTIDYLLYILFGKGKSLNDLMKETYYQGAEVDEQNPQILDDSARYGGTLTTSNFYYEHEETTFSSKGTVVTKDGRQIEFDIEVKMSRTFAEFTNTSVDFGAAMYKDPLVINLDCDACDVKNQKFLFDLDCDGTKESISMLGKGSGFLALDKNGDGIINDGSELFGTKSGDGFSDLRAYDSDGNGWIDEADEIFDKLRVWTVDETGKETLVALGKAGVGAIYLGASDTEFSINDRQNVNQAMVRKTGMFLYENGNVGTVQQIDLAT